MAHSTRFAVLAAVALLALCPSAHAVKAAVAPLCALTRLAPKKPVVPPSRCPAAAELSCCSDCLDTSVALQLVSSNLAEVVNQINPALGSFIGANLTVCDAFKANPKCMLMIESIVCATNCNPDSGTYVTKTGGNIIMSVCPEFATATYDECKGVSISGFLLGELILDPLAMMSMVVANVVKVMGVDNFNITVAPGSCFTGATPTPSYTPCCDPLVVSPKCPAGAVDTVKYAAYINRPIDTAACTAAAAPPPSAGSGEPPSAAPAPSTGSGNPPSAAPAPSTGSGKPPGAGPPPSNDSVEPPSAPPAPSTGGTSPSPAAPAPAEGTPSEAPPPESPSTSPALPSPAVPPPSPAIPSPPPPPKSGAASPVSLLSVAAALVVGAAVMFV